MNTDILTEYNFLRWVKEITEQEYNKNFTMLTKELNKI